MSGPVVVEATDAGLSIHIDRKALLGFLSILIDAKFQPGLRSEVLMSPWIEEMIVAIIRMEPDAGQTPAPPDIAGRVLREIDRYVATHRPSRSREELARQALLPFRPEDER